VLDHGHDGFGLAELSLGDAEAGGLDEERAVAHGPPQEGLVGADELDLALGDLDPPPRGEPLDGDEAFALAMKLEAVVAEQRLGGREHEAAGEGEEHQGDHGLRTEALGDVFGLVGLGEVEHLQAHGRQHRDRAHGPSCQPVGDQLQRAEGEQHLGGRCGGLVRRLSPAAGRALLGGLLQGPQRVAHPVRFVGRQR